MDQCVDLVPSADGDITQLLRQWSDGHDESFRALMSVAYGRLRLIAGASMCHERPDHTLQPTALVGEREEDAFDLDRALSGLKKIDSRKAKILELRVYLGCTAEETAGILNLSKATVDRDMRLACAWLCRELRPEE